MDSRKKNKKGVTLISLVTMIILIVVLTGTMTHVSLNAIEIKRANEVRADLRAISDKVYEKQVDNLITYGFWGSYGDKLYVEPLILFEKIPLKKRDFSLLFTDYAYSIPLFSYTNNNFSFIDYELLGELSLQNSDNVYVLDMLGNVYILGGYKTSTGIEYNLPEFKKSQKVFNPQYIEMIIEAMEEEINNY